MKTFYMHAIQGAGIALASLTAAYFAPDAVDYAMNISPENGVSVKSLVSGGIGFVGGFVGLMWPVLRYNEDEAYRMYSKRRL